MGQKLPGEWRNILPALAQRRHGDHEGVEAVQQVLAKFSPLRHGIEIAIGGGDDPHFRFKIHRTAQAAKSPGFQHPQQFGLNGWRNLADLVQEQRTAPGLFDQSRLSLHGAGEGAALVPKQFGFKQRFLQRTAVHRHQWPFRSRAEAVNFLGYFFLADPAFAQDQHRRFGRRNSLEAGQQLSQRRAVPHQQAWRFVPHHAGVELAAPVQERVVNDPSDRARQFLRINRLDQKLRRTQPQGVERGVNPRLVAQHQHRVIVRPLLNHRLADLPGPGMVQQDQVRRLIGQGALNSGMVGAGGDLITALLQFFSDVPMGWGVSTHQQDMVVHGCCPC